MRNDNVFDKSVQGLTNFDPNTRVFKYSVSTPCGPNFYKSMNGVVSD